MLGARDPEAYVKGLVTPTVLELRWTESKPLGVHHKFLNMIYEYPFRAITAMSIPIVGGIYYNQSKNTHLKLSQQIMQTRVIGQACIIGVLLSTMAFHDFMSKHGKFE